MNEFMGREIPVVAIVLPPRPDAPRGRQWWRHHTENTRAFAAASLSGDQQSALEALGELWKAVLDWQRITKSQMAGVLIAEHTALAKQYVDGLANGKPGWVDSAAEGLAANVEAQRKFFPRNPQRFADLFAEHVRILALYPVDLAKGDTEAFNMHFGEALENAADLDRFTNLTFGV